ncbi:LuxR family transcriptional regulator [Sphaerisporangium melleum]|uniref:LuxR family transcriptional regulator n=1 Tax=Sphaerisporangium melleum TaxID=321316 RepID=A0A917VTX3_9ACTN|nr:LuxR family transcriptional regulator [Sphaerisporangium melleum]GGL14180.1 LuxR family transcriptional regulator [Sphaerisporangium melleum]GII68159.1 LuxR family transcriptional regulator [Sphaerisporangium melleum]
MSASDEDPWYPFQVAAGAALLLGRDEEHRALELFTQRIRDGVSDRLVLVGEIGVGKSRLLDLAATLSADLRVARISGVESESPLGFAALHRLLGPFLDRLEHIPEPQRNALWAAFGLISGPPVNAFLVGLAALGLLAEVAAERPLLCLIDDAQWLDRESAQALAFVARRLRVEGVGMIMALRAPVSDTTVIEGLPVRPVNGLPRAAAHRLLSTVARGPLDDDVARRLATETNGNPLALITLAAGLSAGQLAGHAPLPSPLPLGPHLETYLLTRIRALPLATQTLLLVASVSPPEDQALLWRAASSLGLSPVDADPAVTEGILQLSDMLGGSVAFRHPLTRSAVYGAAHPADRRRAHQALAAACDPEHDPDTRAWHLAAATAGTDENVARDLETSADRARARGGYTAQATFLARAAELSPDPAARCGRLLAAAHAYLTAGDAAAARRLLDRATAGHLSPVLRARGQRLRAAIEMHRERPSRVPAILLDAVAALGEPDGDLTRLMLREALESAVIARRHTVGTTLETVARAALAVPTEHPASGTDLLVRAAATRVALGYPAAVPMMRAALDALRTAEPLTEESLPLAVLGSLAAEDLWDEQARHALLTRLAAFDRENGALAALKITLVCLANSELWAGRFHAARAHHAEIAVLDTMLGPAKGLTSQIELLAWQGAEARARETAATLTEGTATEHGVALLADHAALSMTVLELSLGNYRQAFDRARPLFDDDPLGHGNRALADMVEAAARAGEPDAAGDALARLAERAPACATPWAMGLLARSRALLAAGDPDPLYREALDLLGRTQMVTELARTHLLYGEWLRRHRRRSEARSELRTAYTLFTSMGAGLFADRARLELAATGEHAGPGTTPSSGILTPQEAQIAALAAGGATNAEIATRLYITSSTVEYHLTKVFRKLRLTSRRQLSQLTGQEREEPSGS